MGRWEISLSHHEKEILDKFYPRTIELRDKIFFYHNNIDEPCCVYCGAVLSRRQYQKQLVNKCSDDYLFCSVKCSKPYAIKKYKDNYYKRTGYTNPTQNPEVRRKQLSTILNKYNVNNAFLINKQNGKRSKLENEICQFIKQISSCTFYENNFKILRGLQLDIYIPEKKLAIEVNGDYWHSNKYKNIQYHLNKTSLIESKGIKLIHVWESEWHSNKDFIKTLLNLYLNDKTHQNELQKLLEQFNGRLPRDYFQILDFPDGKIEEPTLEKSGKFDVYKTGYIIL